MEPVTEAAPVVWHFTDQHGNVDCIRTRGLPYIILHVSDIDGIDVQVGDVAVLWEGKDVGNGQGIAAKLVHERILMDRKDRPDWIVYRISEPMDARLISDEGAEAEPCCGADTDCYDPVEDNDGD